MCNFHIAVKIHLGGNVLDRYWCDPMNKTGNCIWKKIIICGITVMYLLKFICSGNNFYITLSIRYTISHFNLELWNIQNSKN